MKILEVRSLAIPDIKVVRYARFRDARGYFTEAFRKGDFETHPELEFLRGVEFVQLNESHSSADVVRGLHFQWSPPQGKLIRPVVGGIIDLALDIRQGSSCHGKLVAYEMAARPQGDEGQWIWVPPGFAHGFVSLAPLIVEYYCTAPWSPGHEAGIYPFDEGLDWSLCEPGIKSLFDGIKGRALLSDKDRQNMKLAEWNVHPSAGEFTMPRGNDVR